MSNEKPLYTMEKAMEFLKKGNQRRLANIEKSKQNPETGDKYKEFRQRLTEGQNPFAILVCCSDSRFPPEIIFQNREGDLFVVRTAGHVVGSDAAGSIEYAVAHLKSPLIVVMGHDKCGAVTAAVNKAEVHGHIFNVMERIYPAVEMSKNVIGDSIAAAVDQHITNTVEYLKNMEPICKKYYQEGKINIVGARCLIDTYQVQWLI
jgi:carbonic anhydrase